ncbi:hypothetical protein G6F63_014863 [Rhizopus arrhizus]|nr:hypothetical protein G6F63_014863 [Rhizopus arrhizus]
MPSGRGRRQRLRRVRRLRRPPGRRRCGDGGGARPQRMAEGPVAEGEPRGSAAEVRLGLPPEAGAPDAAGGAQQWPGQPRGGAGAGRARRRRDAGPRGLPRPLSAASAGGAAHRRTAAGPWRPAARAAPLCGSAPGRRPGAEAHHPPPARPVPRPARWPRIPPGAERGRTPPGCRLEPGRAGTGRDRTRR